MQALDCVMEFMTRLSTKYLLESCKGGTAILYEQIAVRNTRLHWLKALKGYLSYCSYFTCLQIGHPALSPGNGDNMDS